MVVSQGWLCRCCACQCRCWHRRQPAQKHTDREARHGMARGSKKTTASADSADGGRTDSADRGEAEDKSEVESESRVTCTNEQQMRQPARILAPIGATGTEISGCAYLAVNTTSLVALEVDSNEGATNSVPQRVKSKLHMAAARASRPATAPTNSPS